jgi:hypothetical protein
MWRGTDPLVVLRLLVLLSYTHNGLPKKHAGEARLRLARALTLVPHTPVLALGRAHPQHATPCAVAAPCVCWLPLLRPADTIRSEFLAAYGHQHLLTLAHLERAGGCALPAGARSGGQAGARGAYPGPLDAPPPQPPSDHPPCPPFSSCVPQAW